MVSSTRCLLYRPGNDPGYSPERSLNGHQSRFERRADDKALSVSEIEHRFSGRPASSQVVTLTGLSLFMNSTKQSKTVKT